MIFYMENFNSLVKHILQDIIFYVQQKKQNEVIIKVTLQVS